MCCHALQDKVWVDVPDVPLGAWEFYTVLDDDPAPARSRRGDLLHALPAGRWPVLLSRQPVSTFPPHRRQAPAVSPGAESTAMRTPVQRHQVVVVGARVAGAATAMLLARAGHDVVLLDRSPFPSDTVSTHGIARGGVVQLARWGLLDEVHATGAPAVREVLFRLGEAQLVRRSRTGPGSTTWSPRAGISSTPCCRTPPSVPARPCAPGSR